MAATDAVDAFYAALNNHDVEALEAVCDPDFEMVVPQRPHRGFKGRDQELKNMKTLFESYPDFSVTVLRQAVDGNEVWTESTANAAGLEMAAVVIWTVDPSGQHLIRGRYYSERVQRDEAAIDDFIDSLSPGAAR